jgi:hypothetical protein
MAKKFLIPIDLSKNEIQNVVAQNLASAPASPVAGQFYYDTSTSPGHLYWYNGTTWVAAEGGSPTGAAGGDLTGTYPNPTVTTGAITGAKIATGTITDTNVAAANKDGTTTTASLRTLGTGATQAAAGNDSRLSDARTPTGTAGGSLGGTYPNPSIAAGAVGGTEIAAAIKDPAAATAGLRTLGTGAAQAAAGNDSRLSDTRTPSAGSIVDSMVSGSAAIAFTKLASPTGSVSWNSQKITSLADPTSAQDAATKNYVDNAVQGLDAKPSVKAASVGNLTLSGTQTVDGIALVAADRVLVKDQSTASQNGVYLVAAGAWTRAADMDTWVEVPGSYVFVEQGTVNADSGWVATADQGGTLGSTSVTFVQFSGAGQVVAGTGLTKTGNSIDVGAGTGILANANDVAIDTSVVARKFTQLIGNGVNTSFSVTHSLGNQYVVAQVYDASSNQQIECDVTLTSSTVTAFGFAAAPATNAFRVVIIG